MSEVFIESFGIKVRYLMMILYKNNFLKLNIFFYLKLLKLIKDTLDISYLIAQNCLN